MNQMRNSKYDTLILERGLIDVAPLSQYSKSVSYLKDYVKVKERV